MISFSFTQEKFLSLTVKRQHKHAASLLKYAILKDLTFFPKYDEVCSWMNLSKPKNLSCYHDRYYYHMENAQINLSAFDTLENKVIDPLSAHEHLPITVYLDNLRSAFNVGSILRTMEAFRFKTIFFAKNTPKSTHPKVIETSMDTAALIDIEVDFSKLPKPLIALECTESATSIYNFTFPESFTLILGNEALGISQEILHKSDHVIKIPLVGAKNSLNVASAFAITAFEISRQRNN